MRFARSLLPLVLALGAASAPAQVPPSPGGDEARIEQRLKALDAAWEEVRSAYVALQQAEERLAAGVAPEEDEAKQLAGPARAVPPAVGGAQPPAAPGVGGPQAPAAPAVGGPMSGRRQGGGGRNPAYAARIEALEADVQAARARLDEAWRAYDQLK